jgi:hypothetical protein
MLRKPSPQRLCSFEWPAIVVAAAEVLEENARMMQRAAPARRELVGRSTSAQDGSEASVRRSWSGRGAPLGPSGAEKQSWILKPGELSSISM